MLDSYSKELDLHSPLTFEALIASHRRLRNMGLEDQAERMRIMAEFREGAKKIAADEASAEYIKLSDLRGKTLAEIAELVGFRDD